MWPTALLHRRRMLACCLAVALLSAIASSAVRAAEPITIGFSMSLTGGLAAVGKSALLAMKIWEKDVNDRGGLLGRPVKLVYYDDQSNPSLVPGIYTKMLDVDKVDLIISAYATNMIAPAMPVVIQHDKFFVGLLGLAVNAQFHYPRYFQIMPTGPEPTKTFSIGFFELAAKQNPKPQTLAIVAADAEFARNAADGARENAKAAGLKIVYDRYYPPTTTDYTPIMRAVQATNPDVTYVASYPPDTVGILRASKELNFKTKMLGGAMVGLALASMETQLGPMLNGAVIVGFWLPAPKMQFPGVMEMLKRYQAQAVAEGVDPLGYFVPPFAYSQLQVLETAVRETGTLDDSKLADYVRTHKIKTLIGEAEFGKDGEWAHARPIMVQYQNITGYDLEHFRQDPGVIVWPDEYKSGEFIYPYEKAQVAK